MALSLQYQRFSLELHTARDARAALDTTFGDSDYCGGPFAYQIPETEVPAWGWLGDACLLRSDWLPALAAALRDMAPTATVWQQQALVDALALYPAIARLLPWLESLAADHGDWQGSRLSKPPADGGTGPPRLHDVLDRQARDVAQRQAPPKLLVRDTDDLRALLAKTATKGNGPATPTGTAPWDWLAWHAAFVPWVSDALPEVLPWALDGEPVLALAALDYLLLGQDAWRWHDLAMDLRRNPRPWAKTAARKKAKGWPRPLRESHDPSIATWGDAAIRVGTLAQRQQGPVLLDLP